MVPRVYLDWNASAPLRVEAREALAAPLDLCGNPSSVHGEGRAARAVVERAREEVAALVSADPRNVVFTSGGTEANALALTPFIEAGTEKRPFDRLLVSAIEHPSVRTGGRFAAAKVEEIPVRGNGVVDRSEDGKRISAARDAWPAIPSSMTIAPSAIDNQRTRASVRELTNETGQGTMGEAGDCLRDMARRPVCCILAGAFESPP